MTVTIRAIGAAINRFDGPDKVRGLAPYAWEHLVDHPAYLHAVQSTIAAGRITGVHTEAALAVPGVLHVLSFHNAPRLAWTADREMAVLQFDTVAFRDQLVGGVIAETPEIARYAAGLVQFEYARESHDVDLRVDRDDLYAPAHLNAGFPTDTAQGDVDSALAAAAVRIDATYRTAMYHNSPMETHANIAIWDGDDITVYLSSQGVHMMRTAVARAFDLDRDRIRMISPHMGGGFGSKWQPHADVILALFAAKHLAGRPVKFALTRQQMFSQVGYRTPTIQRVQLGTDTSGRLRAFAHDVVEQTAKIKEWAEQTTVPSGTMYAAPHRRTSVRLAALDVAPPSAMRGPGETPGMYAIESAMDEMALACGLDPIEFRIRNEPAVEPHSGKPFSSRDLIGCLREGARRFGWNPRDPRPRSRRENGWLIGTGVAASTYPVFVHSGQSSATVRCRREGRYTVEIGAADLGTGTWTALTQIAADALEVPLEDVDVRIGDTALPPASTAGGSAGINDWGCAIVEAARQWRIRLDDRYGGLLPPGGFEITAMPPDNPYRSRYAMHAFGAQFAEVRVREDSGEIRVPRLLGVFAAGRIINSKTARSQMIGGMTMGLSMALHETGVVDQRYGHVVNQDFAGYHIATNADVGSVEAHFVVEEDPYVNPMGSKGIGELGIVGTAAAIANATFHACGLRIRDLPITLDKLLPVTGLSH